jgi:hypothetical protein
MARWRLVESHYIVAERDGVATEWEYREVSRATGKEVRKKYSVPTFLDPKSKDDWTHRDQDGRESIGAKDEDGYIIVSDGNNSHPRDIILVKNKRGQLPITPGMEPIDDEAKAISAKFDEHVIPIEGREDATYSERLLDKHIQQLADAQASLVQNQGTHGFDKVLEAMTAMMEQNQKLIGALVEQKVEQRRRV